MDRQKYNQCMIPHMRGSKTKEQRQKDMCVGAKICSGKAKTKEEAVKLCSVPKPVKQAKLVNNIGEKPRKQKRPKMFNVICKNQAVEDAEFVIGEIENAGISVNQALANAITNSLVKVGCR